MASGFLLGDFYLRRQHPPKLQNLQKELSRMLWDAATGAALRTLDDHSDSVNSVAFSPDGRLVVSGSRDQTVRLWDATTGAALRTLNSHSSDVTSVAFSPDGKLVHTLFVLNDWIVEGGTIFSGFLLIIERLV
jgi:WD40 repeat protein